MTTPLTDEQLAEIEAGLEGVTEGPWQWGYSALRQDGPNNQYGAAVLTAEMIFDSPRVDVSDADADHIARLNPQTVAAWLARDKAMRVEIERLREALAWYGEQARLCRLVHSAGDLGRRSLDADGGVRARDALDGREPRDNKEEK